MLSHLPLVVGWWSCFPAKPCLPQQQGPSPACGWGSTWPATALLETVAARTGEKPRVHRGSRWTGRWGAGGALAEGTAVASFQGGAGSKWRRRSVPRPASPILLHPAPTRAWPPGRGQRVLGGGGLAAEPRFSDLRLLESNSCRAQPGESPERGPLPAGFWEQWLLPSDPG